MPLGHFPEKLMFLNTGEALGELRTKRRVSPCVLLVKDQPETAMIPCQLVNLIGRQDGIVVCV